jgi:hypothetical protein
MEMTGEAPGEGMNVNIPFDGYDQVTMGDAEYLYAFQKLVLPICYEFAPDLIFGKLLLEPRICFVSSASAFPHSSLDVPSHRVPF